VVASTLTLGGHVLGQRKKNRIVVECSVTLEIRKDEFEQPARRRCVVAVRVSRPGVSSLDDRNDLPFGHRFAFPKHFFDDAAVLDEAPGFPRAWLLFSSP
jgi:hypothetical protein